jgi:uncharacterized membrane protein
VEAQLRELLDLVARWVHVIAGIMWIGNSMLWNWLDRNLEKPTDEEQAAAKAKGEVLEGRIWLLHSGGFYDVVKKQLAPNQLPAALHWFKWQNFSTWLSGICLLVIVYYMGGGALLVDASVAKISVPITIAIGVCSIVVSWFFYDLLWRSPLRRAPIAAAVVSFLCLGGVAFALTHLMSARAAFIHLGVILGTVMTGNVWFVIIPSQQELVDATKEGRAQDAAIGKRAKQRSIHNNYMTFPLLFIMISNHFPSIYGSKINWLLLGVLAVGGALVRHWMNVRYGEGARYWAPAMTVTIVASLGVVAFFTRPPPHEAGPTRVTYAEARSITEHRCLQCHSAQPTDDTWKVPPNGLTFDSPAMMKAFAPRIRERVFVQKTMPLGNKTGITDEERSKLADWVDQGAPVE